MRKKMNIINILLAFIILIIYMVLLIKDSDVLLAKYNITFFYKGTIFAIALIFFALLKNLRNSLYMDLLFDLYLIIFIGILFFAKYYGDGREIQILFLNYPLWLNFILILQLFFNVLLLFKKEK